MLPLTNLSGAFAEELNIAFLELRGALTELLNEVAGDASTATELSRRLSLDKNLAWKVSRFIVAHDAWTAVPHLPGEAGLRILFASFDRCGASNAAIERAARAAAVFRETISSHVGDRETLELVSDGLATAPGQRLQTSRKLAFRGNSGIWGVQARVRVNLAVIAPNREEPTLLDVALVGGWVDFRRLRPNVPWVLFRQRAYGGDNVTVRREQPIDPAVTDGREPMLLSAHCSPTMPPIHAVPEAESTGYQLGEGPIGNRGTFTCYFGWLTRRFAGRYRDASNATGDLFASIGAPVEWLLFDVLLHRDLGYPRTPRVDVFGMVSTDPRTRAEGTRIPLNEQPQDIGAPPVFATPLLSDYPALVASVFQSVGWDAEEFEGSRLVISYPPFPSTVVKSFALPDSA